MNIIRMAIAPAVLAATMAFTACSDKTTPIIIEQSQRINTDLQTLVQENPELIAKAEAQYAEDRINIDVALADSLFKVGLITDPLFNYFTACEIKDHADKNLEILVNALTEKEMPIVVNLTDAYGDAKSYELSPATLRRMVKSPLTQLDYNETRDALFAALAASADQFMPAERNVKEITTSFKGGFYAYNVVFENPRSYRDLVTANLKARAIKVLEARYAKLGSFKPLVFGMFKTLGIDGFHLVYSAGENEPLLKTTVTLSNIH